MDELDDGDEEHVGERFAEETARPGEEGARRWASRTWLRVSRAQDWLSAVVAAKSRTIQRMPPAIWRETAAVGSNAMAKTTTTSSAKKSMPVRASRERHSRTRSLSEVREGLAEEVHWVRSASVAPAGCWR